MFTVAVSLWHAEMLSFHHTSLTQNRTQKEMLLKNSDSAAAEGRLRVVRVSGYVS